MLLSSEKVRFYYDPIFGLVQYEFGAVQLVKFDYWRDKNLWVVYSHKKDKEKLRATIRKKADQLAYYGKLSYIQAKELLIDAYNRGGLPAVRYSYEFALLEILKILNDERE